MYEYKKIDEETFWQKIHNGDNDFSYIDFDFEISFKEWKEVRQELNFSYSIFRKEVSMKKNIFFKSLNFDFAIFEDKVNFYATEFKLNISFNQTQFLKNVVFNLAIFWSDFLANKTRFYSKAYFKKTKFYKTSLFHSVEFLDKADFSYAHFPMTYLTSFLSINKVSKKPVLFIMRNIIFPENTIFSHIDLSKTIFQDSMIERIVFKECDFIKKDGRYLFYPEITKVKKIKITEIKYNQFKNEVYNTIIFKKTEVGDDFNISDRVVLYYSNLVEKKEFFVVTRFEFENYKIAKETIDLLNKKRAWYGVENINLDMDHFDLDYERKVVVLRLKEFKKEKSCEVLEDLYRQMKKSLEESRDWQTSGDFYKSEMIAKIKLLRLKGEKFWYRLALHFYKWLSYFGESVFRIMFILFFSGFLAEVFLKNVKPELSYFDIFSTNLSLFIPIFGSHSLETVTSLNLTEWQNVVIYFEITWFYILWLILAVSIRRKFKR